MLPKARRKIIPYNSRLTELARELRNHATQAEILLWMKLKGKQLRGYDFHRQKPIDNYILDFFCHELMLGIELDGYSYSFEEVAAKDDVKEKRMVSLGISLLRFPDRMVYYEMPRVISSISHYVDQYEERFPQ